MATARKKGDWWYYRFKIHSGGGKYKYIERGDNFRTKKEALEAGAKAEAEWNTRLTIWKPREVLYGQLLKEWQINWCNINYKGSTLDSVKKDIKIVGQYLGDVYIHQLTPKMLQDTITDLAGRGYARSRLGKIKGVMYKSLRWAVEQGMLRTSPAAVISVPAPRAASRLGCSPARELRALTKEEVEAILRRFEGCTAYLPLLLGYRAGLRLGEAFGLEVQDYDIDKKCLHIRQQLGYHGKDLIISNPKYESFRKVQLDDDTAEIVDRHIRRLEALESVAGDTYHRYYIGPDGKVSETPGARELHPMHRRLDGTGTLVSPRIMQHTSRVIHGCEGVWEHEPIKDFEFHQLRHTHISELVAAGYPITWISNRVGHKRTETTYRYYTHETESTVADAKEAFRNFYNK